jgi:hypothetical protein
VGVLAVVGDVDGHPFPAQADRDGLGEHFVIFGYEHSHVWSSAPHRGLSCVAKDAIYQVTAR